MFTRGSASKVPLAVSAERFGGGAGGGGVAGVARGMAVMPAPATSVTMTMTLRILVPPASDSSATMSLEPPAIQTAAVRLRGRLHRTPLLSSETLGRAFGGRAFLKAELFQKTGSFKPRGVLNKLASLAAEERSRGV